LLAVPASIFPDYIESALQISHRSKLLHNFAVPLSLLMLSLYTGVPGLLGFAIGYFHHLLLDATTLSGVWFFWKKVRGPLRSKSITDNVVVITLHYIMLVYYYIALAGHWQ